MLGRRDQKNEQDDAPVAAVSAGEAPPHVEWEMSAKVTEIRGSTAL